MKYPLHQRMSLDAFDALPRKEGWRYRYQNGFAHVSPARILIDLSLPLHRPFPSPSEPSSARAVTVVAPQPTDIDELTGLFFDSFRGTVDFASYESDTLKAWSGEFMRRFFGAPNQSMVPRSCLAHCPSSGRFIGAALLATASGGEPLLDALFVAAPARGRGVASVLLASVCENVAQTGATELLSRVMLGNRPSERWHRKQGFRELPNPLVARHRAEIAEARRRQHLAEPVLG